MSESTEGVTNDRQETVDLSPADQMEVELRKIELERFRLRLAFWRTVIVSGFAAIIIAAIPPLFKWAVARIEYEKAQNQLSVDAQNLKDQYVKAFLEQALTQDIELRIRLAEYFKHVSSEAEVWTAYYTQLVDEKKKGRELINDLEARLARLRAQDHPDSVQEDSLSRQLEWAYNEIGYVAKNKSVAENPRAARDTFEDLRTTDPRISLDHLDDKGRQVAQVIIDRAKAAGFDAPHQIAFLVVAMVESNLNPAAVTDGGAAYGLYSLHPDRQAEAMRFSGVKDAHELTAEQQIDYVIYSLAKGNERQAGQRFATASTVADAVDILVRYYSRPPGPDAFVQRSLLRARAIIGK